MLTPQDVQNKEFDKARFGGYDTAGVDDFLEEVADSIAALQKENATLNAKMKVLVSKIEEYRETEDALRMALVSAQKTAGEITSQAEERSIATVSEAEAKAATIVEEAETKSRALLSAAETKCRGMIEKAEVVAKAKLAKFVELAKFENERLNKAAENAAQYISSARKMAEKQLQFRDVLAQLKAEPVELPNYALGSTAEAQS